MHPSGDEIIEVSVQIGITKKVTRLGEKEMPPKSNNLKKDLENMDKGLG